MKKSVLIIGGSSGMGLASAKKFVSEGYHVFIIHRDRRSTLEIFQQAISEITHSITAFNIDGTQAEKIEEWCKLMSEDSEKKFETVVHAISRGNLKPLFSNDQSTLNEQDIHLTIDAMAINVFTWVKHLIAHNLIANGSNIITLTSAGSSRVWAGYAAVGLAKSTLENLTRYIAAELGPKGIRANTIHAGITITPSLQMIPGHQVLIDKATAINPMGRLTTPDDVANAVYLLSRPEASWITGSLLHVDGGEHLVS